MQSLRGITVQHGDRLLSDDRPGVHAGINEVTRAAGDLDSMIEGLLPGLKARERRQQARMYVDNPSGKSPEELALEHTHESGQRDQVHLRLHQLLDKHPLGSFIQLGSKV